MFQHDGARSPRRAETQLRLRRALSCPQLVEVRQTTLRALARHEMPVESRRQSLAATAARNRPSQTQGPGRCWTGSGPTGCHSRLAETKPKTTPWQGETTDIAALHLEPRAGTRGHTRKTISATNFSKDSNNVSPPSRTSCGARATDLIMPSNEKN